MLTIMVASTRPLHLVRQYSGSLNTSKPTKRLCYYHQKFGKHAINCKKRLRIRVPTFPITTKTTTSLFKWYFSMIATNGGIRLGPLVWAIEKMLPPKKTLAVIRKRSIYRTSNFKCYVFIIDLQFTCPTN